MQQAYCEVVGGRSSSTTLITSKDATSVTYETQVKVHPLFDSTQGTLGCQANSRRYSKKYVNSLARSLMANGSRRLIRSKYNIQRLSSTVNLPCRIIWPVSASKFC